MTRRLSREKSDMLEFRSNPQQAARRKRQRLLSEAKKRHTYTLARRHDFKNRCDAKLSDANPLSCAYLSNALLILLAGLLLVGLTRSCELRPAVLIVEDNLDCGLAIFAVDRDI